MKVKLDKILEYILIFLMSVLVIDVLWQVTSRYIFAKPSSFTDELAGFLLIWVGLLGAAYTAGAKQHLAIDILLTKANEYNKRKISTVIQLLILLFALCVMVAGGVWLVISRFYLGQVSSALEIPLGYVYLVVPVSGIIICFYSTIELLNLRKV